MQVHVKGKKPTNKKKNPTNQPKTNQKQRNHPEKKTETKQNRNEQFRDMLQLQPRKVRTQGSFLKVILAELLL